MAYNPAADSNCQGWWRLENGALTTDSSGEGNTLTNSGVASNTTDYKEGSACGDFEYDDPDCLYISDANLSSNFPLKSGDTTKEITVCFWFKAETVGSNFYLFSKYHSSSKRSFAIRIESVASRIELLQGYVSGILSDSRIHASFCTTGRWYHVGVTYKDSDKSYRIRIWDDTAGAILGTDKSGTFTNNISLTTAGVALGGINDSQGAYDGLIDDVVVFNRVLSTSEIDEIRNQTFGASNVTVSPSTLSLSLAQKTPTYTGGTAANVTVSPTTLSLSLTQQPATAHIPVKVTVSTLSLSLTQQPIAGTSQDPVQVSVSTLSLALSAHLGQFDTAKVVQGVISEGVDTGLVVDDFYILETDYDISAVGGGVLVTGVVSGTFTDNQPSTAYPKTTFSGTMAESFMDDFYYRIHTDPARLDLGPVLNDVNDTVMVWNAWFSDQTCTAFTNTDSSITLTGLTVPFTLGELEHTIYDMTVAVDGSADIDATLTWDFGSGGEGVTIITGTRMTALPYPPVKGLIEHLQWLTDILVAKDGSEQRIALRTAGRQGFEGQLRISGSREQARFDGMLFTWAKKSWGFPLWFEAELDTATITAGATSIAVDTSNADWRDSGLAMIWQSDTVYEVVLVDTVSASSVALVSPVVSTYTGQKLIMPVRIVTMPRPVQKIDRKKGPAVYGVSLDVTDNIEITGYTADVTYQSLPVLTTATLARPGRGTTIDPDVTILDYQSGPVIRFDESDVPHIDQVYLRRNRTKAACWAWRQFLHQMKGRQGLCWVSTWKNDFEQVGTIGASDTSFNIVNLKYSENVGVNDLRHHIVFTFPDGRRMCREVLGISVVDASTETVAIDSNLGESVAAGDCVISWLDRVRLGSDQVEMAWSRLGWHDCQLQLAARTQ